MAFTYIYDIVDKTHCIGNTLSTINANFTALDTSLSALSTYTVNSVNYLSTTMEVVSTVLNNRIQHLCATLISVSANLQTQINFLSTNINYVSANVVKDYMKQGTITQLSDGQINWDTTLVGRNAKVILTRNGVLNNPTGLIAGESGNLVVQLSTTSAISITSIGNQWLFPGSITNLSSVMNTNSGAYNLISFYYDGTSNLTNIRTF